MTAFYNMHPKWYDQANEAYSVRMITSGPNAGHIATFYNGAIICLSDNAQDAIDYVSKYAAMRVSAFNVEMPNLLALANTLQGA